MDKQKVLDKIKKCLALSQSSNEHEAAQALKHAQALMREHGLTEMDVSLAEVNECAVKTAKRLPDWQIALINVCELSFGVDSYSRYVWLADTELRFYGTGVKPELAMYAYEVLLRQCRQARREYLKKHLSDIANRYEKNRRADHFCVGWVGSVYRKVKDFAVQLSPQEKGKLELYRANMNIQAANDRPAREVSIDGLMDMLRGQIAGENATLHHAMTTEEQKQIGVTP